VAVIREATSIVGDLKGLAGTGVRAIRTRLELLAIEIKEEKAWLVRLLIVAVAALYLLTFGLLLGIFALALWASDANRPLILAAAAGFFLAGGIAGAAYILVSSKKRHPVFKDTIAILKGDEESLRSLQGTGDD
jgi:uncharacterized membrane protein YqjE